MSERSHALDTVIRSVLATAIGGISATATWAYCDQEITNGPLNRPLEYVITAAVLGVTALLVGAVAYRGETVRARHVTPDTTPADDIEALRRRAREAERAVARLNAELVAASTGLVDATRHASSAEEGSRAQIVADLHDTVAQTLIAALYAEWNPNTTKDDLLEIVRLAERELRSIMAQQRPPELTQATLEQAITTLTADHTATTGAEVVLDWPSTSATLPYPHAIVIYRCIQESLTNIRKHARADHVTITGSLSPGADPTLTVTITDDGLGFDTTTPSSRFGIALMRRRAELIHAGLSLESSPGHGTTVTLEAPPPPRRS